MQDQLNQYLKAIHADFEGMTDFTTLYGCNRYKEFGEQLRIEEGKVYIKVISGNSVHSFIVKEDSGKFKKGDILKAASWKTPAKNFIRGNIIEGGYTVRWTGTV
jgi:hypothetical protein